MTSKHPTPAQLDSDKLAEDFGFKLAIACASDESFGESVMRGFTRSINIGPPKEPKDRSVDERFTEMGKALIKVFKARKKPRAPMKSSAKKGRR